MLCPYILRYWFKAPIFATPRVFGIDAEGNTLNFIKIFRVSKLASLSCAIIQSYMPDNGFSHFDKTGAFFLLLRDQQSRRN